jgi:hypothetical protein
VSALKIASWLVIVAPKKVNGVLEKVSLVAQQYEKAGGGYKGGKGKNKRI